MPNNKPKIFLSYAHIDLGIAKKVYNDLNRYNLDIWFDKESLLPGQQWEDEIENAIRESDFFIVLLSSKSTSKMGFIYSELRLSFEILDKYCPASKIFIIPVRLDSCNPKDADKRLAKIQWIDIFPESEYKKGIDKILKVVSPGTFVIRNEPIELSSSDVNEMLKMHGYYDRDRNPEGKGFSHQYELKEINDDKIVFDKETWLIWQQSGSDEEMEYEDAKTWVENLNRKGHAGFKDWRLPTLEEGMSLMEPSKNKNGLYINSIFDKVQGWIWTSDLVKGELLEWVVYFDDGLCSCYDDFTEFYHVRAVRSGQSF